MAQLRPEVRPDVTNMPVDGFLMQTGGSAKRRVVPFNTSMGCYTVTGVPGHTHNSSAVCSVLVDNTEKSNVAFTISEHFANAEVLHAVNDPHPNGPLIGRYTDSAVVDEADYDRAIERGIGEIAIIPENCHQEIREPVRDIYELRTLVTPKDKLDTLTYVEEVGGFVDQTTGEVPYPEPLYPDVQVDLLFDYDDPVNVNNVVDWVTGNAIGTGNRQGVGIATELRFEGDLSTAGFTRDANGQGNGTSFAVLVRNNTPFARAHGADWNGTVTMQWDPNARQYFCPSFEVTFDRIREVENTIAANAEHSETHESFEVQFPRISTQVSVDGQCVFAGGDRPLSDGGTPVALECTVNQYNLIRGVKDSKIKFWVRPFRVATGYRSAIYGAGKIVSYFNRVRNTTVESLATHTKQVESTAGMFFNDGNNENQLQASVRARYHTAAHVHLDADELPRVNDRNDSAGTAWYGLPVAITDVPSGFGYTNTLTGVAPVAYTTAPNFIANENQGFQFLPGAIQGTVMFGGNATAVYVAAGPNHAVIGLDNAVWATALPAQIQRRVQRRFDFDYMIGLSQVNCTTRQQFNALLGAHANENVKYVTVTTDAGDQVVPEQSEDHYFHQTTLLEEELEEKEEALETSDELLTVHRLNVVALNAGLAATNADADGTNPAAYGFGGADAAAQLVIVQAALDAERIVNATAVTAVEEAVTNLAQHREGAGFVYGLAPGQDKLAMFPLPENTHLPLSYVTTTAPGIAFGTNQNAAVSKVVTVPCTLRYMFRDKMLSWRQITDPTEAVAAVVADPDAVPPILAVNAVAFDPGDPVQETHWGSYGVGFNIDDEKAAEVGHYQQQDTAPFSIWTEPSEVVTQAGVDLTVAVNIDVRSLMNMRAVHQDFPETVAANWNNAAGNGFDAQAQ